MPTQLRPEELVLDHGERWRRRISKIRALKMVDAHRATLAVGPRSAEVRFEPLGWVGVSLGIEDQLAPVAALEATSQLDGNIRYAETGRALKLVADTQLDGEVHLSESFAEIRTGLEEATGGQSAPRPRPPEPLTDEQVERALKGLTGREDFCVRRDDGWELRPLIEGYVFPVQMAICGGCLRIHRGVTAMPTDEQVATAMADQALRFNGRLRFARLALKGGELVAETQLHRGLIQATWLATGAQAVAATCCHVQAVLKTLGEQREVAGWYYAMMLADKP